MKRKNKIFGEMVLETALELTESRIGAVDLRNKGSGPHINKSVGPRETQSSLVSSSSGGQGEGQAFRSPEACCVS